LVITGGKKIDDLRKAVKIFYKTVLLPYRDYSSTLNYVQVPAVGNLATIVEEIVEQFGDEQEMAENEAADDFGEDYDDLSDVFDKADLYEDFYNKQLSTRPNENSPLKPPNKMNPHSNTTADDSGSESDGLSRAFGSMDIHEKRSSKTATADDSGSESDGMSRAFRNMGLA
jgi:hypothetical protein